MIGSAGAVRCRNSACNPIFNSSICLSSSSLTTNRRQAGLIGAGQGGEHEFQHGPFAEGVGEGLGSAAFLAEELLEEVGGPNRLMVGGGQVQVGDAGLEVVLEAGHRAGGLPRVAAVELLGGGARRLRRKGLVRGKGVSLDLALAFLEYLRP